MSKIKVLHFIWSANFGGIEKMAIELAYEQNKSEKIQAALLVGCNKGQFLNLIEHYKIQYLPGGLNSGYDLNPGKLLAIKKAMMGFDILHLHTFNPVVFTAAVLSGKKIVYTIHGNFNYGKKIRLNDRINNLLKKYFLNHHTDSITFNSKWCRDESIKKFDLKETNTRVIYNGLPPFNFDDPQKDSYAQLKNKLKGKFVVGTVSRFNKSKRIDRLIAAFADFARDKNDVSLLLVGEGVEMDNLQQLVREGHIEEKTIFTGYQPETVAYQKLMNVCVFPYENEAFGLVVLESLALGKPVLIFEDSGGMKEITGNSFPQDIVKTVQELVLRLNFHYSSKDSSQSDEQAVRQQLAAQFTIAAMQNEFLNCYNSLVK